MSESTYITGTKFSQNKLRACHSCRRLATETTFLKSGCPSCPNKSCTKKWSGVISVLDPQNSIAAKITGHSRSGMYALSVAKRHHSVLEQSGDQLNEFDDDDGFIVSDEQAAAEQAAATAANAGTVQDGLGTKRQKTVSADDSDDEFLANITSKTMFGGDDDDDEEIALGVKSSNGNTTAVATPAPAAPAAAPAPAAPAVVVEPVDAVPVSVSVPVPVPAEIVSEAQPIEAQQIKQQPAAEIEEIVAVQQPMQIKQQPIEHNDNQQEQQSQEEQQPQQEEQQPQQEQPQPQQEQQLQPQSEEPQVIQIKQQPPDEDYQ